MPDASSVDRLHASGASPLGPQGIARKCSAHVINLYLHNRAKRPLSYVIKVSKSRLFKCNVNFFRVNYLYILHIDIMDL
jgi:hypothetical protein